MPGSAVAFGQSAIRMGLVDREQVERALDEQKRLNADGAHKLIGLILLEQGALDTTQLIEILRRVQQGAKA